MTPLRKYIWLIKLLHDSDGKTFESINKEWLKFRQNTEDKNMPIQKRTFHNHIKAIREEYGIHIECGPGYKYYISDSEKDILPKIELLSTLSMLSETVTESRVNKSLYVETISQTNTECFRTVDRRFEKGNRKSKSMSHIVC